MKKNHWDRKLPPSQVKWAFDYIQKFGVLSHANTIGLIPSPEYSHEEIIYFLLERLQADPKGKNYLEKMKGAWRQHIRKKGIPVELNAKTYSELLTLTGRNESVKDTLGRIISDELKEFRAENKREKEKKKVNRPASFETRKINSNNLEIMKLEKENREMISKLEVKRTKTANLEAEIKKLQSIKIEHIEHIKGLEKRLFELQMSKIEHLEEKVIELEKSKTESRDNKGAGEAVKRFSVNDLSVNDLGYIDI